MKPKDSPPPEVGEGQKSSAGRPDTSQHIPQQVSLDDVLAERDRGAEAAELSMATGWRLAAERALDELIASGCAFTAEDIYAKVGEPLGGHRSGVGGLILRYAKQGRIAPTGVTTAKRPAARARLLRVWRSAA